MANEPEPPDASLNDAVRHVPKLSVIAGNITQVAVDAIVNAANERMLGGGGVDGAIHAAAGPELLAACRAVPEVHPGVRCPIGEARITPAFCLPARFVIHTVGPRWRGGTAGEAAMLANCYKACLNLAVQHGCQSIAFPAISTGAFGYPLADACRIAVAVCASFLEMNAAVMQVVLVGFSSADVTALRAAVRDRENSVD
jgi:O-acetyl-ADP-ribose deacetylase (regulator of RNase III)